ncbi:hypothetical protein MNEG_12750 [Monoraphidium neglectum]|uniref:Uncharacterized protein n=1 Tax=Monoraphidium neglectum TaxID=145388 RepID=A0A0D2LU78_9CHLO|nr:hypothetical protein MNEG_12750 [Monoraphidium neglectum]KIY95214.1 hypothetical protein MNEG_12750 [Monoraphidium neglectum]|eukprot:XP_013894234.1 hypothetical protein MNEG_12750 [Monoraphidium neglectum]
MFEQQPPESEAVAGVVRDELSALLAGAADAKAYAQRYAAQHAASPFLARRAAAAEMLALVDAPAKAGAVAALVQAGTAGAGEGAWRPAAEQQQQQQPQQQQQQQAVAAHAECVAVEGLLAARGGPLEDAAAAAAWRAACAEAFPRSTHFGGPKRFVEGADGAAAAAAAGELSKLSV